VKNSESYKALFRQLSCCVIIPTYNNAKTIAGVIADVSEYCDDIIVVNDGCSDSTPDILSQFSNITVTDYGSNKGKGYALRHGFSFARDRGYEFAITIDSDGQHYASDIPVFLERLLADKNILVIGSRRLMQENVPGKSTFGNNFSNFWFKVETGITLPDTQSGYRLYPIKALEKLRFYTDKFEFEIEVIVRAAWEGIAVQSAPVDVFYPEREERISHFRPFKDFTRIGILNTVLVTLALLYYHPRSIVRYFRTKTLKQIFREDVLGDANTPVQISVAIAFGVFMGIVPIWGYQLLVGFLLAHLLKINKAIFFLAANISLPPMIPLLLYLSYVTGSYVLGAGSWQVDVDLTLEAITGNLKQYIIGATAFAAIAGMLAGILSYVSLLIFKRR